MNLFLPNRLPEIVFCGECGTRAEQGAKFCQSCGSTLASFETPAKPLEPSPSSDYQQPTSTQPVEYTQPLGYNQGGYSQPGGYAPQSTSQGYIGQYPQTRSYINWFLISIFTFGIGYVFYAYFVAEDLEKLEMYSQHNYGNAYVTPNTRVSPVEMILWYIFFSPVYLYKKYNSLYQHLNLAHGEKPSIPSGQTVLIAMGITIFTFWLVLPIFIFAVVFLVWENQWQNAMNRHIINHDLK
jgi:hypothetical protein